MHRLQNTSRELVFQEEERKIRKHPGSNQTFLYTEGPIVPDYCCYVESLMGRTEGVL